MRSLLTAFSIVFVCISKVFYTNLQGKVVPAFYTENQFIVESQLFSTCKLILPPFHTPADKVFVYGKRKRKRTPNNVLSVSFSCLCLPFTHRPYSCWTRTETHKAVPCGECLTCAIQLAGYFCLCEWAVVSLSKLWAQQRESCESQSLTSREIPSLHPTARWLISAE